MPNDEYYQGAYTGPQIDDAIGRVLRGEVGGPPGAQGPQGETGPQGPEGPAGPKGPAGEEALMCAITGAVSAPAVGEVLVTTEFNREPELGEKGQGTVTGEGVSYWITYTVSESSANTIQVNSVTDIRGQDGTVSFNDLTEEQREGLRGPQGIKGPAGPQGPVGPQGPAGGVGQDVSGQEFPLADGTTAAAESYTEIFNDYAERTYETVSNDGTDTSVAAVGNIAIKAYAHAEGERTSALGEASHAEGFRTVASGGAAHAEGGAFSDKPGPQATGYAAHAEGVSTIASGAYSHAEGGETVASKNFSHAEGYRTEAAGAYSHTEGYGCYSKSDKSHIEGNYCLAADRYGVLPVDHVDINSREIFFMTNNPFAIEAFDHIEIDESILYFCYGEKVLFTVTAKNAESLSVTADGDYSRIKYPNGSAFVIRDKTGLASHTEGQNCFAYSRGHAEGEGCGAWDNAHAEGTSTYAMGFVSHTEGGSTKAYDYFCHAEGENTIAWGACSHVEGKYSYAGQTNSHVEGNRSASFPKDTYFNIASYRQTEPKFTIDITDFLSKRALDRLTVGTKITVLANNSNWVYAKVAAVNTETGEVTYSVDFAPDEIMVNVDYGFIDERKKTTSSLVDTSAHAEGIRTIASGKGSHAEGERTIAYGDYSHASGDNTCAIGEASYAGGIRTIANQTAQTVIGRSNVASDSGNDLFIVGKGSVSARANAFRATLNGTYASGNYNSSGADYAELFQWADNNPKSADRCGLFVTLQGDKIKLAGPDSDYILGIVSGSPSVVGDVYDDQWQGMYLSDVYGRPIMEEVEVPEEAIEVPDPEDPEKTIRQVIIPAHKETRQKLNPAYDPAAKYIPRTKRPEWDAVGMLGKLVARDDGSCQVDGYCAPGRGGVAAHRAERTAFRVIERLDDRHIRVLII